VFGRERAGLLNEEGAIERDYIVNFGSIPPSLAQSRQSRAVAGLRGFKLATATY